MLLPRRKFLIGSGQLAASLFVAPAIASYTNLMHIDSELNRLVVAYRMADNYLPEHNVFDPVPWAESAINIGNYTPAILDAWTRYNKYLKYKLVRRGEIDPRDYFKPSANFTNKKMLFEMMKRDMIMAGHLDPANA